MNELLKAISKYEEELNSIKKTNEVINEISKRLACKPLVTSVPNKIDCEFQVTWYLKSDNNGKCLDVQLQVTKHSILLNILNYSDLEVTHEAKYSGLKIFTNNIAQEQIVLKILNALHI